MVVSITGANAHSQGIVDMDQKSKGSQQNLKEHGLSKLLRDRKLTIFRSKKRFDRNRGLITRHEEINRAHHKRHYGVEKLKWEWGTVDHLGVYAFGGGNKDAAPTFRYIQVECPKRESEKTLGWYCYVGPIPEFEA